jgi:3(or 17)beta-hydroxysteroid dehydrogenase
MLRRRHSPQLECGVRHETAHHGHFPASRGLIQTDMGEQTFVSRARNLGSNDVDAVRQQAMSRHPIGRLGVPDDIAKGIVFLASDDSGLMAGAGLVVDGGSTAQ